MDAAQAIFKFTIQLHTKHIIVFRLKCVTNIQFFVIVIVSCVGVPKTKKQKVHRVHDECP